MGLRVVVSPGTGLWSGMSVGLGVSIVVGADAKLAVQFEFCGLKSFNQYWDLTGGSQ